MSQPWKNRRWLAGALVMTAAAGVFAEPGPDPETNAPAAWWAPAVSNGWWREAATWGAGTSPAPDAAVRVAEAMVGVDDEAACGWLEVGPGGALRLEAGGRLTVQRLGRMTGGRLEGRGTLVAAGRFTFDGTESKVAACVISNRGILAQGAGPLALEGGLFNNAGATYLLGDGARLDGGGVFFNYGVLLKSGPATARIGCRLQNYDGLIEAQAGTLVLAGGGVLSGGRFEAAAGAMLDLAGAAEDLLWRGLLTGQGSGVVQWAAGSLDPRSDAMLQFPVGLHWRGGTLRGQLVNLGLLQLDGTGTNIICDGRLNNQRRIEQRGGTLQLVGSGARSYCYNEAGAVYDFAADGLAVRGEGPWHGDQSFNNFGLLRKSAGGGTTEVQNCVFHNQGGVVEIATGTLAITGGSFYWNGGELRLRDGGLAVGQPFALGAGRAGGRGMIRASSFVLGGELEPGAPYGTLRVEGPYQQTPSGVLRVELGGRAEDRECGRLAVLGHAALDGRFEARLAPGFAPAAGDRFLVLTCASLSGAFAQTDLPTPGPGLAWSVFYEPTGVVLQVVTAATP